MNSSCRQWTNWSLRRREPPVVRWKGEKLVLAEVSFEKKCGPKLSRRETAPHVDHSRFEASFMTDPELYARSSYRRDGHLGLFLRCAERLLTEYVLPRFRRR